MSTYGIAPMTCAIAWKIRIRALIISLLLVCTAPGALAEKLIPQNVRDPFPVSVPNTAEAFHEGRGSFLFVPAFLDANLPWVAAGLQDPDCKNGVGLITKRHWPEAFAAFQRACLKNPNNAVAVAYSGFSIYMAAQFPKETDPASDRGDSEGDPRLYKRAALFFERAVQLHPDCGILHRNLGLVNNLLNRADAAKSMKQAVKLSPQDVRCLLAAANYCIHHQKYAEGIKLLQPAIADCPNSPFLYFLRANANESDGRNKEADADYTKALSLHNKYELAYYERGVARCSLAKYDESLADFSAAIRLDPKDAEAYNYRGLVYGAVGDYSSQVRDHKQAIALAPNVYYYYSNMAWPLLRLKRFSEALASIEKSLQLQPDQSNEYSCRAFILYRMGRIADATKSADRALDINPQNHDALELRGHLHELSGDYEQAVIDLENAKRGLARDRIHGPGMNVISDGNITHNVLDRAKQESEHEALKGRRVGAKIDKKQLDDTISGYSKLIRLSPKDGSLYWNRAVVFMCAARYREAIDDFSRFLSQHPGADLSASADLFVWVCFAMTHDRLHADKALANADLCQVKNEFMKHLISYKLGRINSSLLLTAAHSDTEQIRAHYFIAIDDLLRNNTKEAVANLQIIQNLPESGIDEYALANTLLTQLKK